MNIAVSLNFREVRAGSDPALYQGLHQLAVLSHNITGHSLHLVQQVGVGGQLGHPKFHQSRLARAQNFPWAPEYRKD